MGVQSQGRRPDRPARASTASPSLPPPPFSSPLGVQFRLRTDCATALPHYPAQPAFEPNQRGSRGPRLEPFNLVLLVVAREGGTEEGRRGAATEGDDPHSSIQVASKTEVRRGLRKRAPHVPAEYTFHDVVVAGGFDLPAVSGGHCTIWREK